MTDYYQDSVNINVYLFTEASDVLIIASETGIADPQRLAVGNFQIAMVTARSVSAIAHITSSSKFYNGQKLAAVKSSE